MGETETLSWQKAFSLGGQRRDRLADARWPPFADISG
jgi:hypothetical protein